MNNDTATFAPILDTFLAELIEASDTLDTINPKDLRAILMAMPEGRARDMLLARIA